MLISDLRYAVRSLSRARGFTLAVVLTLGLGIGANTAIFSVVRGVLLKPLPHKDGERLVYLRQSIDGPGGENVNFSVPEINDFREGAKIARRHRRVLVDDLHVAGRSRTRFASTSASSPATTSRSWGCPPSLGRLLDRRDDGVSVPPVMVLTHEYWMKRFGGDREHHRQAGAARTASR